ncbi:MAG: homoserine kinase [Actinomycetota bacterium]|jgi:homoserine kinase|nr:MAG: homoserine kinase [Actinomycetota bacterium]
MRVAVRVPATSANLGPGFDCLGLALDLCNEVVVDTEAPPGVVWRGEGAQELPTDGSDLVSRTMAAVGERFGVPLAPLRLEADNRIPLERGLGSSCAAVVAGIALASRVCDLGLHADPTSVFALAAELEGHPDNAAPACFGGLVVVADGAARRLEPHPSLRPVLLVPPTRLPTEQARRALPAQVPFADAAANAAGAAMAVVALTQDPSVLPIALRDRLHQPTRLALVPEVAEVFADLEARRVPVCLSGAGPTLLAFERPGAPEVPAELVTAGWRILRPGVRASGYELVG